MKPSTPVGRRRLLKLADLLEADSKNRKGVQFDMGVWGVSEGKKPGMSCNTKACALGVAALSGVFKRAGLEYDVRDWGNGDYEIKIGFRGCAKTAAATGSWDLDALGAAQELFEISERETHELFLNHGSALTGAGGERAVAQQIREFVAGKYERGRAI